VKTVRVIVQEIEERGYRLLRSETIDAEDLHYSEVLRRVREALSGPPSPDQGRLPL